MGEREKVGYTHDPCYGERSTTPLSCLPRPKGRTPPPRCRGFAISRHSALQERGEEEVRGVCCWRETIARSTSIEVGVHCASAAPAAEQPLNVDAGLTRVRILPPAEEPHGLGGARRAIKAVALLYQELRWPVVALRGAARRVEMARCRRLVNGLRGSG